MTPSTPANAAMIVGSIGLLFLPARQHRLQITVVGLRSQATDEADFFRLARCGDADALRAYLWFLFTVIIVEHRILITLDSKIDRRHLELGPEVMRVLKLRLRALPVFGILELDLSRQSKPILQIPTIVCQVLRRAHGDDPGRAFDRTTENDAFIFRAQGALLRFGC